MFISLLEAHLHLSCGEIELRSLFSHTIADFGDTGAKSTEMRVTRIVVLLLVTSCGLKIGTDVLLVWITSDLVIEIVIFKEWSTCESMIGSAILTV